MLGDVSHFFRESNGTGHLVIMYTSGPETLCKLPIPKDRVFAADTDLTPSIVSCDVCSRHLHYE